MRIYSTTVHAMYAKQKRSRGGKRKGARTDHQPPPPRRCQVRLYPSRSHQGFGIRLCHKFSIPSFPKGLSDRSASTGLRYNAPTEGERRERSLTRGVFPTAPVKPFTEYDVKFLEGTDFNTAALDGIMVVGKKMAKQIIFPDKVFSHCR